MLPPVNSSPAVSCREWPAALSLEAADQQTVALLETLLERLADGVFVLDRKARFLYWSPSAERLTGRAADDLVGQPAGEGLGTLAEQLNRLTKGEASGMLDTPGGRVPVRVIVMPATGAGGVHLGRVCAIISLQAVWMERAQQERLERLASVGRSVASAVHQIRNPLGATMGFADLLERDLRGQDPHDLVVRIQGGFTEVNRRIDELLCYVRPRPLHLAEADLGDLLSQIVQDVRARFPNGPSPVFQIAPPSTGVFDPRQVRQAVENLVVNAIEAAGPKGEVKILLNPGGAVSAPDDAETFRLLVRNTGAELSPDRLREIFEPFASSKPGGTGLGLALARNIITGHGGEIEAVSAGGLTTFVLTLPRAPWERGDRRPDEQTQNRCEETRHAFRG